MSNKLHRAAVLFPNAEQRESTEITKENCNANA